MRLTKQDIETLKAGGVCEDDIKDMFEWGSDVKCFVKTKYNPRKVSYKYAINLLGREQFLWAVHRAMYHKNCYREPIYFENVNWGF